MNLIFLDMDGVVNSSATWKDYQENRERYLETRIFPELIDPILRSRINEVIDLTKAKVVWSSSWRIGLRESKRFIEAEYNKCNFSKNSFLSFTPITHEHRYIEILSWLMTFGNSLKIEKCLIIDDSEKAKIPNDLSGKLLETYLKYNFNFIQTNEATGFTEENKLEAINFLTS